MTDIELKKAKKDAMIYSLTSIGKWFGYIIAPIVIVCYLLNDAFLNGVFDNGHYFFMFIFFAGVIDAVKDTCAHHYSTSVFKNLSAKYWNAEISHLNKYNEDGTRKKWFKYIPVPVIFTDAWHLFKSFHTIFIVISVWTYHLAKDEYVFGVPVDLIVIYVFLDFDLR